jgi:hypothetical protein
MPAKVRASLIILRFLITFVRIIPLNDPSARTDKSQFLSRVRLSAFLIRSGAILIVLNSFIRAIRGTLRCLSPSTLD